MYLVIYGSVIYFFILSIFVKRNKTVIDLFALILLTFITFSFGLRYGVGTDYYNYEYDFYNRYSVVTLEYLYYLLRYFIKVVFNEFYVLTFVMMFITNLFIYLGLKKRNVNGVYLLLALMIYLSSVNLIFLNLMRQGVAVAIFFYASMYIDEKKFKKYLFYVIVAAGFHISSLALLPLYFIKSFKITKTKYLLFVIVCYFFVYIDFSKSIINYLAMNVSRYYKYYNHEYILNSEVNLLSIGVLLNVIFLFVILVFTKKNGTQQRILNYYAIGTLINILALSSFMFDRIGVYFFVFGIAIIPKLIEKIDNVKLKLIFFVLAFLIASLFYIQSTIINPESLNLVYDSIFKQEVR